jgi:hypothetical protein
VLANLGVVCTLKKKHIIKPYTILVKPRTLDELSNKIEN